MTSFAASGKWSVNSEQVFINQLNFQPTSIGKHNSMGHLLPCAINFKTNHPPIHLQWIGILGMATEPRLVISMGPRQPEVRCHAIVCSDILRVKDSIQHVIFELLCVMLMFSTGYFTGKFQALQLIVRPVFHVVDIALMPAYSWKSSSNW